MANMSYCRFQNTASDLADCFSNLHEAFDRKSDNGWREHRARAKLIELCEAILEDIGPLDPDDVGTAEDPMAEVPCKRCGDATLPDTDYCIDCEPEGV